MGPLRQETMVGKEPSYQPATVLEDDMPHKCGPLYSPVSYIMKLGVTCAVQIRSRSLAVRSLCAKRWRGGSQT